MQLFHGNQNSNNMNTEEPIRLTQFSHGGGCGCKIAPKVLETILSGNIADVYPELLVGNSSKDDAAVYQLNETEGLISTTDFFTPIVDDAFVFGQVAAANAISDVYAMGGTPIMALAILGWPVDKLPVTLAQQVLAGARSICKQAGIPLAGGHSIDTPEPIFGLSVNGKLLLQHLKHNDTAKEGNVLLLTKPIGVGILATAAKRGALEEPHRALLYKQLTQLNDTGEALGKLEAVTALTDVTGFGIMGHLIEMAEGSGLSATIHYSKVPLLIEVKQYLAQNIIPDATYRNWNGYGQKVKFETGVNVMEAFKTLPDPQTNGGLLIAVNPSKLAEVQAVLVANGYANFTEPIGVFTAKTEKCVTVLP
jgi:selenide,water dikinase